MSVPVGLRSSFEIDSFNLCLNTLKVKFSNELFSIWRLQINFDTCKYKIMKLCGVVTILTLCKTDLKIACLLNLFVVGVIKCHILASTKRTKVFLLANNYLNIFYRGHRLRWGTGSSNKNHVRAWH